MLDDVYEIDRELKVSFKLKMVPHLYRCPDEYYFDINVRRCQRKEIAVCRTPIPPTKHKAKYQDVGLLQLLFLSP